MTEVLQKVIKYHPKTKQISQIPKEGVEYALVSDTDEQVHQLVWCKDFIQDAIHGYLNNAYTTIYGFSYDPEKDPPVSLKRTRLIVTNWKDPDFGSRIQNRVVPILHEVEDRLGIRHSKVQRCHRPPPRYAKAGLWLFDGSTRWSKAPPMVSFYTMIIRMGLAAEPGESFDSIFKKFYEKKIIPYYDHEEWTYDYNAKKSIQEYTQQKQAIQAKPGVERIFQYGDKKIFYRDIRKNYPPINKDEGVSIYTIHDRCGIAAYGRESTKEVFPHWHRTIAKEAK